MSKINNIFKSININNLESLEKKSFFEAFIIGHELHSDYVYLKNNMPELLEGLNFDGSWKDYEGNIHILEDNVFMLGKIIEKNKALILGEAKFKDDGKINWIRYDKEGSFRKSNYLIYRNSKGYRGTLTSKENKYCKEDSISGSAYYFYENEAGDAINFYFSKYSDVIEIEFRKKGSYDSLSLKINKKEDSESTYFLKKDFYKDIHLNNDFLTKSINYNDFDSYLFNLNNDLKYFFIGNDETLDSCINCFEKIANSYFYIIKHFEKI